MVKIVDARPAPPPPRGKHMGLTWRKSVGEEVPQPLREAPFTTREAWPAKGTEKKTQTPKLSGLPRGSGHCCPVLRGRGHQKCPALHHGGLSACTLSFPHRMLVPSPADHTQMFFCRSQSVPDRDFSHQELAVLTMPPASRTKEGPSDDFCLAAENEPSGILG